MYKTLSFAFKTSSAELGDERLSRHGRGGVKGWSNTLIHSLAICNSNN
ncbi:hypothetical protein N9L68_07955 [bacterium]|nr:hypothetical protein [bacterium]